MNSIETTIVKDTRTIEVKLSGDLEDADELKSSIEKLVEVIEANPGQNLILDLTDLEMPGMKAFSLMGRIMDDRFKNAQRLIKNIAIVDAGKISELLPIFFIKPPENMFFMNMDQAREHIQKIS